MLRAWFDAAGEFNAAAWVLLSDWSGWLLAVVGLVVAGVMGLAWHNARALPARRRRVLLLLRALAVSVLLVVFFQPGVRLENVTRVRNHVAVLVDTSRSMDLPGASGSRLDDVKARIIAEADVLAGWRENHQVDWYSLAEHARAVADVGGMQANGDATRLVAGLEDIAARFRPEELAAVVVISDGADNGLLGEVPEGGEIPGAVAAIAGRLGAPVHTLYTGPKSAPADVAITDVAYDEFAFVRNAVTIGATVTVTGYDDLSLPVTLRRGATVLGTRTLRTRAGESRYDFDFEFVPDKTGKDVFTLEVGTGPGEQIRVNNRRQFVVRIIRDKIRVLQVVGRPSWDERFLRKLLKRNPNVDLISFFILRTSASIDVAGRDELSLIPFPTRELFEEQLGSFDLIVFQNFTYRGYQMVQYLPLIRDYVRDGGGFVMAGGDLSFTPGGYADTAIAEFLPVRLPDDPNELIWPERFRPGLTEAGLRHPITALSLNPDENRDLWSKLPPLSGMNRVLGPTPDATVLATHPSRQVEGQPAPVVITREFGQGRVLAVTSDSTWNWAFEGAGDGGDSRHYYKFWGNAIRWLIKDPALNPLRVEADRDRYPIGAEASLTARLVGPDYQPVKESEVTLTVERRYFDEGGTEQREIVHTEKGQTTETGERVLNLTVTQPGAYTVRAAATQASAELTDEDVFVVAPDPIELRRTAARADTLAMLAKAGRGEARTLDQGFADLARTEPAVQKVNRRKDVPVWASAWLLLLGILIPSLEWFLRRRWGLM